MKLEIPKKSWFKIGEVSRIVNVAPHVIRYWEQEFRVLRLQKTRSNQRLFQRSDIETIALIRILVHEKRFTIPGAEERIREFYGSGLGYEQILQSLESGVIDPAAAAQAGATQLALTLPGVEVASSPGATAARAARGVEEKLAAAEERAASASEARDRLRHENERLEGLLGGLRAELDAMRSIDADQRRTIDHLTSELHLAEASTDVLDGLRARIDALEDELTATRAAAASAAHEARAREAALELRWKEAHDRAEALEASATAETTRVHAETNERNRRIADLERELERVRARAQGQSALHDGLRGRVARLRLLARSEGRERG